MNWREYPMARLLLPFILGIGTEAMKTGWQQWVVLTLLAFLLALLGFWQRPGRRFSQRWWFGAAAYFFLFFLGLLLAHFHDERRHPGYLNLSSGAEVLFTGRVHSVEPAGSKFRALMSVQAVADSSGRLQRARGHILAYLEATGDSCRVQAGDVLMMQAEMREPAPPLNPKAFDYRRYLHYQNVHYQAFVEDGQWRRLDHRPGLDSYARRMRHAGLQVLKRHLPTDKEYAVASALILGYKAALSDTTRDAYAHTGAMHVLAVSGLHVGIIQMLLSFFLLRVRLPGRYWPLLRTALLLAGIWGFALLTGAAPSVLRAATLFSFLSVGQALHRRTNIYNTLAASAFLLLCIDPFLLFNVGFQLSYMAVLGIVYFQPLFYRQWYIENRLGDYLWKLLAVSLAAQLTTLPLSLYYFHQFPLYFWLSGLAVVPAAALILSSGLALFALQAVPVLGWAAGQLLYGATWMVNAVIFLIQQLPGGLVEGFWIGPATVALLYLALIGVVAGRAARNFKWVLGAMACLLVVAALQASRAVQVHQQRVLTVYHIPRATAVGIYEGQNATLLRNSGLAGEQLAYACQNHQWYLQAWPAAQRLLNSEVSGKGWWFREGALQYGAGRLLAVADRNILAAGQRLDVDVALLCNGVDIRLEELRERLHFRLLLIDGSNPPWKARKWKAEAEALGVACHYTGEDGAWVGEW